jgi:tellurite resistance protein TehA-like permease
MALVPHIVIVGILLGATTACAGGAKGLFNPPPGVPLLYFIVGVTFFVVGALMWFVLGVFTDRRFTGADPRTQVKLAREALGPVIQILGGLQTSSAKAALAT